MATTAQELANLRVDVARIGEKLDNFLERNDEQDTRAGDLEKRTRTLENRQHWYAGAGTVVGFIVSFFIQLMGGHR